MYRDPLIRSYSDPPPHTPTLGSQEDWTYRWPVENEPDVALLRSYMQEQGRGLYVLRMPTGDAKVLVQAFYPDEISSLFAGSELYGTQLADYKDGRLVVTDELALWRGPLDPYRELKKLTGRGGTVRLVEFKRNNRNARLDLKRQSDGGFRAQELSTALEGEGEQEIEDLSREVGQAFGEELDFASKVRSFVPKNLQ